MNLMIHICAIMLCVFLGLMNLVSVLFGAFSIYGMIRFCLDMRKSETAQQRRTDKESAVIYAVFAAGSAVISFVLSAGIILILRGM